MDFEHLKLLSITSEVWDFILLFFILKICIGKCSHSYLIISCFRNPITAPKNLFPCFIPHSSHLGKHYYCTSGCCSCWLLDPECHTQPQSLSAWNRRNIFQGICTSPEAQRNTKISLWWMLPLDMDWNLWPCLTCSLLIPGGLTCTSMFTKVGTRLFKPQM